MTHGRITRVTGLLFFVSLSLPFGSACSSSESTSTPNAADAGADAPTLVDFTMFVADPATPTAFKPLAGASAIFDGADGSRVEGTSDAEGRVVFKGVNFGVGPATVTAWHSGRVTLSLLAITPEGVARQPSPAPEFPGAGKDLILVLQPIAPALDTVKLGGNIGGKLDAANNVTISSSPGRGVFQSAAATYSMDVKKDTPLTLVAMEWTPVQDTMLNYEETKLRFVKYEAPAQGADGTLDLELATGAGLTAKKIANLTLDAPAGSARPPGWQVQSLTGPGIFFLGSRSKVAPSGVGTKTFVSEGEYVDSPVPNDEVITFAYFPGFDGNSAIVQTYGPPVDGSTIAALAYPKKPSSAQLGGDVTIADIDPAAEVVGLEMVKHEQDPRGGFIDTPVWNLQTLRGAGLPQTVKVPDLPEGARALLPNTLTARVVALGGSLSDKHKNIPARLSWSQFFPVSK